MARYRCPGCGKPYDGRKCKNCFYETFTEEVAHGNHYHAGEPLVLDTAPKMNPYPSGRRGCESYEKKRKTFKPPKWLTALLTVLLLNGCSMMVEFLDDLDAGQGRCGYADVQAEPENVPAHLAIPEDAAILYEADGIRVAAQWDQGTPMTGEIPVVVCNETDRPVLVTSMHVSVDGFMTDDVFLFCEGYENSLTRGSLYLDSKALEELGIKEASGITMVLDICDGESYEHIAASGIVTLGETVAADVVFGGTPLFDGDFDLSYWGAEMGPEGWLELEFYGENNTGDILYLSSTELLLNGQSSGEHLYQAFLPGARAVIRVVVYDPAGCGLDAAEDLRSLEFALDAFFDGETVTQYVTDPIVLEVN